MNPWHLPRKALDDWAVNSQLKARRNAMLASTRLAQHRAERLEVDAFLASRQPSPQPVAVPAPVAAHR